jgi:cobalt-zinc-cadmium efflux system protein
MPGQSQKPEPPADALTQNKRTLTVALAITAAMMVVEAAGGFLSGSLALLADAGHMLTDAAALGLSLFAFWLSSRPKTASRTFGWRRFEIFAAFVNGLALWTIAGVIGYEAFKRLSSPPEIESGLMMIIAVFGLASNILVGAILFHGRRKSLNTQGAFLHVLADALGSVGVLAAALLIKVTGSYVWDPAVSAGVCLLILWSSGRLVRDSFHVLMEGAPAHLDIAAIREELRGVPGVLEVHDLHVWTITSGFVSLSAHLKIPRGRDIQEVIRRAQLAVSSKFQVSHATFQPEIAEEPGCETASCPEPKTHEKDRGPARLIDGNSGSG